MSDINKEHIKVFRQYFLSHNEEIRRNMRHLVPGVILKYLSLLEDGLMRNDSIKNTAYQIGAANLLPELKQLQLDYYISLADIKLTGKTNQEIERLLANDNKLFKDLLLNYDDVKFNLELKQAFVLSERELLKRKFQELDKILDIGAEDIGLAFKLIERQKLKEQFQKIEYGTEREAIGMVAEKRADYSFNRKTDTLIKSERMIKFKWKPIAIAATIVGLIMTTTAIVFVKNKTNRNIAGNKPNRALPVKENTVVTQEFKNNFNDLLVKSTLIPEENQISVIKQQSFGFATKDEKLIIRKYYIKNKVSELEDAITSKMHSESGAGNGAILKLLIDKRDSINNLANKYSLNNNILSIYLFSKKEVKVFKINLAYYLIIEDKVYECKNTANLLPLKNVTDKAILEKSKTIMFNNSN